MRIMNKITEINIIIKIKIVHKNLFDFAEINNNILKRASHDKDIGKII